MTIAGMALAFFVQPIAGALSDRANTRLGRRRPYVLAGGVLAALMIPGFGLAGGYAGLFITYCLLQFSTNTAQGPYQGFIPDLVPESRHGTASGVKGLLEVTGGIATGLPFQPLDGQLLCERQCGMALYDYRALAE
jgi:Na+/melibiose symporter-like transporter